MRSSTPRLLLLVALAAVVVPASVTASSTRTAGTLNLNAAVTLNHGDVNSSEPCLPPADECVSRRMFGPFPGLGQIDGRYEVRADFAEPECAAPDARVLGHPLRLAVAGRGVIDLVVADAPCVALEEAVNEAQTFTIIAGTGSYVGASGSGTMTPSLGPLGDRGRFGRMTLAGTLNVPGLEFDVTAPTLTGATNKTAKAKKGKKFARVAFRVTALDDREGVLLDRQDARGLRCLGLERELRQVLIHGYRKAPQVARPASSTTARLRPSCHRPSAQTAHGTPPSRAPLQPVTLSHVTGMSLGYVAAPSTR